MVLGPHPEMASSHIDQSWWLSLAVLFVLGLIGAAIASWITHKLNARYKHEADLLAAIQAIQENFHVCQTQCATHRSMRISREEHDKQWAKIDASLSKVHTRIDKISEKMGIL